MLLDLGGVKSPANSETICGVVLHLHLIENKLINSIVCIHFIYVRIVFETWYFNWHTCTVFKYMLVLIKIYIKKIQLIVFSQKQYVNTVSVLNVKSWQMFRLIGDVLPTNNQLRHFAGICFTTIISVFIYYRFLKTDEHDDTCCHSNK